MHARKFACQSRLCAALPTLPGSASLELKPPAASCVAGFPLAPRWTHSAAIASPSAVSATTRATMAVARPAIAKPNVVPSGSEFLAARVVRAAAAVPSSSSGARRRIAAARQQRSVEERLPVGAERDCLTERAHT